MEPIKWLEGGGCVIDGRVWVNVITHIRIPGKGYPFTPMYFDSEKSYWDATQRAPAPSRSP